MRSLTLHIRSLFYQKKVLCSFFKFQDVPAMANIIKQALLVATTKEAAQRRSKDSLFHKNSQSSTGKTLRFKLAVNFKVC